MLYAMLLLIIFYLAFMYVRQNRKHFRDHLRTKAELAMSINDYRALDKGMTEITDAYESDMLTAEETIAQDDLVILALRENSLIDRIARHEQAATIDGLRRANAEYHQENLRLNNQIDICQVIISEHDLNCLPHITRMMEERSQPLKGGYVRP